MAALTVIRKRSETRWPTAATLLLAGFAAGCAGSDPVASVLAQPGKYEYYPCPQLIEEWRRTSIRERELKGLMDKAARDTGGALVSALAYQSDYLTVRGELRMLETEAQRKKCEIPQWRSDRSW
jgi:hypothetical protein